MLALTTLIEGLFEAVGARFGIFPIRGPLFRFLWKRLFRVQRHFACLAARFAAGKALSPRRSRPRGARVPRHAEPFRLTRWVNPKAGWLCRIVPGYFGASAFSRALRDLLTTDAEMLALLAATPATARILAPLCWMLGVPKPASPALAAASRDPRPEATHADDTRPPRPIAEMPRRVAVAPPPDPPGFSAPVIVALAA